MKSSSSTGNPDLDWRPASRTPVRSRRAMPHPGPHRTVRVDAYCLVSNWKAGGQIVRSWDLQATMEKRRGWQIGELSLIPVPGAEPVHPDLDWVRVADPLVRALPTATIS